jgi:hypothetical protein
MNESSLIPRVLAIDPTTSGFAYAIFEGPDFLLDWGLTQVRAEQKNALCLKRIDVLLGKYAPDVVVLEAYDGKGSHRRRRVRSLIRSIQRLALKRGVRKRAFSRAEIRKAFGFLGKATKHPIASEIAKRYPQLTWHLPGLRKFYESEDERMSIFDAASLAVTYFETRRKQL